MARDNIKAFLTGTEKFKPVRWVFLALGLVLLVMAQVFFETRAPLRPSSLNAEIWNAVYKLEIPNYQNVYRALPFLYGGFLIWLLLGKFNWQEPATPTSTDKKINWKPYTAHILIIVLLYGFLIFQLARHQYSPFYPYLWIITLTWSALLIWKWDRQNGVDTSLEFSASDLTLILILLFIGIFLGAFALTDVPRQIVTDEDFFWQAGKVIATGEFKPIFFDSGVFTFPATTNILQGWVMRIFGTDIWGWRFSSVLPGVATVIPLYFLARDWFGKRVAFIAGLLMLVNPYFLSFSRFGYNNIQSLFPVTLAIFLWEKGIRKDSVFYLWLGGLAAGLGYYSFFAAWIGVVTIGLSIFLLALQRQITLKKMLVLISVLGIAFIVMAAPRLAYVASGDRNETLVYKIFEASFVNAFYGRAYYLDSELAETTPLIPIGEHHTLFYNPRVYWELLTRGTVRTLLANLDPFIPTEHFMVSGFAGTVSAIFFIIGLALAFKSWKQYRSSLLLIWFFSSMLFLSILNSFPPRHTHLVAVIPALAILSAVGLVSAVEQLSVEKKVVTNILLSASLIMTVLFSLRAFFIRLPEIYPNNFEEFASWITWREKKELIIIYAGDPTVNRRFQYRVAIQMIPGTYINTTHNEVIEEAQKYAHASAAVYYEGLGDTIINEIKGMGYTNIFEYEKDGKVLGYALSTRDLNFSPDTSIAAELDLLLKSPAAPILGTLLIAMLISATAWKNASIGKPKPGIKDEADKGQAG